MREEVRSAAAPAAVGPYSQAIRCAGERMIYTAGQIGLEPASGALVAGGVRPESEQALRNIRAVLEAAGSSLSEVVKVSVYLADMGEFAEMNAVYERFFLPPFPARSTVEVSALPKGARVEFDAVAVTR